MFLPHPNAENRQSRKEKKEGSAVQSASTAFLNNHNTIKHTGTQQNNIQHNALKTYDNTFLARKRIIILSGDQKLCFIPSLRLHLNETEEFLILPREV
jgi:hypothetical protein